MRIRKTQDGWSLPLRWAHDAKRVLDLPDEFTEPETEDCLSKEANELLVCLLRGKFTGDGQKFIIERRRARRL